MVQEKTYRIVRRFEKLAYHEVISEGLTLEEAKEHCSSDETKGSCPNTGRWMDTFEVEA
jgi:hypothetical protein